MLLLLAAGTDDRTVPGTALHVAILKDGLATDDGDRHLALNLETVVEPIAPRPSAEALVTGR